jgi:hypothetical protein
MMLVLASKKKQWYNYLNVIMIPPLQYFDQISLFGPSTLMLGLVLAADLVFTGIHVWQEWKGEKYPLYRAFGAIVGFWFPRGIGFALFTVGLAVFLWAMGITAYTGWLGTGFGIGALGFVLGARASDSIISHWALSLAGYRPNPGLSSTLLYVLEIVLIVFAFQRGLSLNLRAASIGIICGFAAFVFPLPVMAVLRFFIKSSQYERWVRGKQIPEWAVTT